MASTSAGGGALSRVGLICGGTACDEQSPTPTPTPPPNQIEYPTPGPISTIALPFPATGVSVASDGTVWASLPNALGRIDPDTNQVSSQFQDTFSAKQGELTGIATRQVGASDEMWMSDSGGFVWHVSVPPPNDILTQAPVPIDVGGPALGVAVGAGSVWVTVVHDGPGELVRIDPTTNEITGRYPTGDGPKEVAVGAGGVWVEVTSGDARIQRFDPSTGDVLDEEQGDWAVAATESEAWASGSDTVQRLSANSERGTTPATSPEPQTPLDEPPASVPGAGALTIAGDQVWVVAHPKTAARRTPL